MNANLINAWTPILKALPEGERERARELIEKYGETYPTSFIVELLEIFGIHIARAFQKPLKQQLLRTSVRQKTAPTTLRQRFSRNLSGKISGL